MAMVAVLRNSRRSLFHQKCLVGLCLLVLPLAALVFGSCSKDDDAPSAPSTHLRYRFASKEEGRWLKMGNADFINGLNQNDLDWKTCRSGATLDEYRALAEVQTEDFTEAEKKALSKVMDFIESRCVELDIQLPLNDEIVFIKSDMEDEGHAGGYTHKNQIYLGSFETERTARAFQGDTAFDADYWEYRIHFIREVVAHEIFHVITRNDAQFRQLMYSFVGFNVMDREVEFGSAVRSMLVSNPDVERYDNWAEFTIGGVKRRCILTAVYTCSYAQAVATDPEANFFDYTQGVLVPLDEPNTMIPIGQATDFYDVMGHNSDYFFAAEEYLADNFSYLIAYGFNGRYDHSWAQGLFFIPYQTPQLIRQMHNMLTQYYPVK